MLIQANAYRTPLPDESVNLIVTSPPYKSKRNYGLPLQIYGGRADCEHSWGEEIPSSGGSAVPSEKQDSNSGSRFSSSSGQFCLKCQAWRGSLGLEPTIDLYIQHLVEVFRECWRVLRDDGVMFVNIGDSYAANRSYQVPDSKHCDVGNSLPSRVPPGLKPKNLCLIPQRLIIALQEKGWIVRSEIIWAKPNPMPESATDRPTVAHETIFMVTKKGKYFWDEVAVREKASKNSHGGNGANAGDKRRLLQGGQDGTLGQTTHQVGNTGRNLRTVWTIPTENYSGAHFATFPKKLCIPPILGGTSAKGACGACGAQWVRTVEKRFVPQPDIRNPDKLIRDQGGFDESSGWAGSKRGSSLTKTTGWEPSCSCNAKVVPAIVLDIFCGTGTVGKVAKEAGRRFIGFDLSEEYLALAMTRAEKRTPQAAIEDEELTLFAFAGLKG